MYESANFNTNTENLEKLVFAENKKIEKNESEKIQTNDKPIPKPPPQYWTDPLSYRRFNRESEGTSNIL